MILFEVGCVGGYVCIGCLGCFEHKAFSRSKQKANLNLWHICVFSPAQTKKGCERLTVQHRGKRSLNSLEFGRVRQFCFRNSKFDPNAMKTSLSKQTLTFTLAFVPLSARKFAWRIFRILLLRLSISLRWMRYAGMYLNEQK
jgi:hypothetical protein